MKISFLKKFKESNSVLTRSRLVELKTLTKELDIRFRSYELLNLALTHRSVISKSHHKLNNERLEFLGDSVLGLAVTEYLYLKFPNSKEGDLAKIKSYVVSEEVLSQIGFNIGLDRFLLIGKGEEASGGRKKKAILEDAFEALLGAYYLDVGYKKSKSFILSLLAPEIDKVLDGDYKKDYKTIFQEYIQKKRKVCPKYKLLRKSGPDHDTMFIYQVIVSGEVMGTGRGKSRKIAEQSAAKTAYKKIIETP